MKNKTKKMIKYFFSIVGLFVSLFMIGLSIYYLYSVLITHNYKEVHTNYVTDSKIDYQVYMKDNNFIPDEYLSMDKNYINKLVDEIIAKFKFNYINENEDEIEYAYELIGSLNGIYRDDVSGREVSVWTESESLAKVEKKTFSGSEFIIEEEIKIDLQKLNNRVKSFQEEVSLAIKSNYILELKVNIVFDIDSKKVNKTHITNMLIPVNATVFSIEKSILNSIRNDIIKEEETQDINNIYIILAVSLLALSLIVVINIFRKGFLEAKTDYEMELEEIFKLYGERIITVENIVRNDNTEFIDILGFEEMIELVNELNLPILCWTNEKTSTTWFCAIKGDIIYRCIIE